MSAQIQIEKNIPVPPSNKDRPYCVWNLCRDFAEEGSEYCNLHTKESKIVRCFCGQPVKEGLEKSEHKYCKYHVGEIGGHVGELIPKKFLDDGCFLSELSNDLKKYYKEDLCEKSKGIYLWGPVGTGKSYALFAIIRDLLWKRQFNIKVIVWSDFLEKLRAGYSTPCLARENHQLIENLQKIKILIIDDVGSEKPSEFVEETFLLLINKRYNDNKITLITSNLEPNNLKFRIGERSVSRVCEMCKIIPLDGFDRRIKKDRLT